MANVSVAAVETGDSWAPGSTHSVSVKLDNSETVGPVGWGPVVCPSDGLVNDGHMTDVTLRIRSTDGSLVFEETVPKCVPVERPSTSLGPNATAEFTPSVSEAGDYTVQAVVQVRGDNGRDQSDLYPLTVSGSGSTTPEDGDERGGGLFPGSGIEDATDDPLGSAADNPLIALAGIVAVLILLSSYADLAASVVD